MKALTQTQLLDELRARVDSIGSQRKLAIAIGCSQQYLSDVLSGRRLPGPLILRGLGYEQELWFKAVK